MTKPKKWHELPASFRHIVIGRLESNAVDMEQFTERYPSVNNVLERDAYRAAIAALQVKRRGRRK